MELETVAMSWMTENAEGRTGTGLPRQQFFGLGPPPLYDHYAKPAELV